MEERKMTEKESLELISQMITKSRVRLERQAGWPLVLWGVAAALIGIAVWAGVKFTGNAAWYNLWFLLLIGFPIHWIWAKRHTENVRDYVTETVGWVWFVFGASCMVFAALYALGVTSLPINVCITLLLGFATTVTGMMLKRWLKILFWEITGKNITPRPRASTKPGAVRRTRMRPSARHGWIWSPRKSKKCSRPTSSGSTS